MNLDVYAIGPSAQKLVVAPRRRHWMDAFAGQHPYRCLPLAIANTYGWQLLLPADVTVVWNGGMEASDITIDSSCKHQVVSNFKRGVLTFDVSYIFRTPPGYHLLVTGPTNEFKDGVAPMTALIESDWLPYPFTFNYQLTHPGTFSWRAGEPYAQIAVVPATLQEQFEPKIRSLSEDPRLASDLQEWSKRRRETREQLVNGDASRAWDKDYLLGRYADGRHSEVAHTVKSLIRAPVDLRTSEVEVPAPSQPASVP